MIILVVEDDPSFNEALCSSLTNWGHDVHSAIDGEAALRLINLHKFEMVFSDLSIPKLDGLKLLEKFREFDTITPFYIITGYNDRIDELNLDENTKILNKPFRLKEFRSIVEAYQ
ncbi:MAG: response regulator [Oligoflexales bacterium]